MEKEMAAHSSVLAWWATVHGVAKSQAQLGNSTTAHKQKFFEVLQL